VPLRETPKGVTAAGVKRRAAERQSAGALLSFTPPRSGAPAEVSSCRLASLRPLVRERNGALPTYQRRLATLSRAPSGS